MEHVKMLRPKPKKVDTYCKFLGTLFSELQPALDGTTSERSEAISEGQKMLRKWVHKMVGGSAPSVIHLVDEVSQAFLTEVFDKGLVDRYQSSIAKPTTYFGTVCRRIAWRLVREERRQSEARRSASKVECKALPSPLDIVAARELTELAMARFASLSTKQKGVIVKIYPFFDGSGRGSPTSPSTEYVDRHRGMKAIRAFVLDKCGQ